MKYTGSAVDDVRMVIRTKNAGKGNDVVEYKNARAPDGKCKTTAVTPVAENVDTVSSGSVVIISGTLALNIASAQALIIISR